MREIKVSPHNIDLVLKDFTKCVCTLRRIKALNEEEVMAAFCLGMIAISQSDDLKMTPEEVIDFVKDLQGNFGGN